jgi:hypothetical protein
MEKRWKQHIKDSRAKRRHDFQQAIHEFGPDVFDHLTLVDNIETLDEAKRLERQLINKLNTQVPNGYNMNPGGGGHHGQLPSASTRQKQHEKALMRWSDPERRSQLIASMSGIPKSQEHKDKLRVLRRGTPMSDQGKAACRIAQSKRQRAINGRFQAGC